MRLPSAFIKLPFRFDAERLAQEALQFSEDEWTYHPNRHNGNTALALVSANGEVNDRYDGEMRPTSALQRCRYVHQVIACFQTVVGRSRFMRLAAGAEVPSHNDGNYTWRNRVRLHIPVITHPDIAFSSVGNIDVHMSAGEVWTFDNWRQHAVYNRSDVDRIHLVVDTVGTSQFWDIVGTGWNPATPDNGWSNSVKYRPFEPEVDLPILDFERFNALPVRSPDEIDNMLDELLDDLGDFRTAAPQLFEQVALEIQRFKQDWRSYWALYWDSADHIPQYELLGKQLKARLKPLLEHATFDSNEANAYEVAAGWIASTTDATLAERTSKFAGAQRTIGATGVSGSGQGLSLEDYIQDFKAPKFDQPIFIVAAPRSGSTMLYEALQKNKDLWTIGDESQREFESIPRLHPKNRNFESNELAASDYTPQIGALLMDAFMNRLQNAHGSSYLQTPEELRPSSVRFLEKTPKNSLRIPFLRQMFPDAKFIFLHRSFESNIGSIIDAWGSQRFVTYANLPDWDGPKWSLLLPAGWRNMRGRSIPEIAAWQWARTNERIMDDLARFPNSDWTHVSYESLLADPIGEFPKLCNFMDIPYGPRMQAIAQQALPHSRYTLTAPHQDKWKRHEKDIRAVAESYSGVQTAILELG